MRPPLPSSAHALLAAFVACSGVPQTEVREPAQQAVPAPSVSASAGESPRPTQAQAETDDTCAEFENVHVVSERGGAKRHYSLDGYTARTIRIQRAEGAARVHCVLVAWPPGQANTAGQSVNVAPRLRESWLRLLENTLARIPWHHARILRRLVIDDRPTEHGIAPFDRRADDDARDGRTIWLHEHLFTTANHWARGNHGSYWSYHVNEDDRAVHDAPETHDLFSPVLIHEMGHLVMYHLVNRPAQGVDATAAPSCAHTCGETQNCAALRPSEREQNCISPYCMPFKFPASTENWAEQYRFYFQSSRTRHLLQEANARCLGLLHEHDHESAPWLSGKPDMTDFHRSMWQSCGGKACKGW
jgi:hypothetical protein